MCCLDEHGISPTVELLQGQQHAREAEQAYSNDYIQLNRQRHHLVYKKKREQSHHESLGIRIHQIHHTICVIEE